MLLLGDADVVDLATDCCYYGHQTEGSLCSESPAPDLKSQGRWSLSSQLAHDLCHNCQSSWKSKNLSFFFYCYNGNGFVSQEDPYGGKFTKYRKGGSDVGRPQFDRT